MIFEGIRSRGQTARRRMKNPTWPVKWSVLKLATRSRRALHARRPKRHDPRRGFFDRAVGDVDGRPSLAGEEAATPADLVDHLLLVVVSRRAGHLPLDVATRSDPRE